MSRSDRLTRPSGTPLPWYRSNSTIDTSVEGADERIVPRTAAAGKASSTRIDRSRTIDGKRGSDSARSGSARAPQPRPRRDRFRPRRSFAGGKPARLGDRGHELADDAEVSLAVGEHRAARPGTRYGRRDAAKFERAGWQPSAAHSSSTTPFTSKKSTGRARRRTSAACGRCAAPRDRRRAPFAGGREPAAGLEQPDVLAAAAPVVRARVDQSGSSDGRSTANFSDSGFAIATGSMPGIAEGRAPPAAR